MLKYVIKDSVTGKIVDGYYDSYTLAVKRADQLESGGMIAFQACSGCVMVEA